MPTPRKRKAPKPSLTEARELLDMDQLRPAPFSPTDASENRAIVVLEGLLNHARIKTALQRRDKWPNIDGFFEVVDEAGYSIGQLDVQVKAISGNNLRSRSFPCGLDLLGYCSRGASRQVLLICVDTEGRQAFWLHLSREFIKGLRRKPASATVSVKFPAENLIPADETYIGQWTEIVREHARRMHQLVPPSERVNNEEEKSIALLIQANTLASESYKPEFSSIQDFLDEFNRLLDNEFKSAKTVIYPNAWKVGMAFSLFSKQGLCYSLFPISRGHNEPFIRQVDASLWNKISELKTPKRRMTVWSSSGNPIQETPLKVAQARACELVSEVIAARALPIQNHLLARELIFSLIDGHGIALGLPKQDEYRLEDLASAFYDYLPRWVEHALETQCPDRSIPAHLCGPGRMVDFDSLRAFFASASPEPSKEFHQFILSRPVPNSLPLFGSERYPLGLFQRYLGFLAQAGVATVQRPYIRPSNLRGTPGSSRLPSELWLPEDFAQNFKLVMSSVLPTYNEVVTCNFPLLQRQLSYFRGFERAMIILRRAQTDFGTIWEVQTYELSCKTHTPPSIDIYCEGLDLLPSILEKNYGETFEENGRIYTITSINSKVCEMNFFLQPLFQEVYALLAARFQELTDDWLMGA